MQNNYMKALRKKQEELLKMKNASAKFQSKYLYKIEERDHNRVRILPYRHAEDSVPFIEVGYHYNLGKYRAVVCPKYTFGEPCALCNLVEGYRKQAWGKSAEGNPNAEVYKISYSNLKTKERVYSPILVRPSSENPNNINPQQIYFWGYSKKKVFEEQLLPLYLDEEWGVLLDEIEGRDMRITYTKPSGKNEYARTTVSPAPRQSPILPDASKIEDLLANIPNIWDVLLERKSSADIQAIVDELLDESGMLNTSYNIESSTERYSANANVSAKVKNDTSAIQSSTEKSLEEMATEIDNLIN